MLPPLVLGGTVYYIWFQLFYNKIAFQDFFPYADIVQVMTGIALNFTPIFLLFLLMWVFVFGVSTPWPWLKIVLDIMGGIVSLVMVNMLFLFTMRGIGFVSWAQIDWTGATFNAVFIVLGIEVVYWMFSYSRQRQVALERERSALKYKYEALTAQVNPHFLFNSLGTLSALISAKNDNARQFIKGLSEIYHYILSRGNRDTVILADELDLLHSYLEVLSRRYGSKLTVDISRETGVSETSQLIPFTLQLLVENVLKHNVITTHVPMHIDVSVTVSGITVSNQERLRENTTGHGFALHYLETRYRDMDSSFRISREGGRFTAQADFIHLNRKSKWQNTP